MSTQRKQNSSTKVGRHERKRRNHAGNGDPNLMASRVYSVELGAFIPRGVTLPRPIVEKVA